MSNIQSHSDLRLLMHKYLQGGQKSNLQKIILELENHLVYIFCSLFTKIFADSLLIDWPKISNILNTTSHDDEHQDYSVQAPPGGTITVEIVGVWSCQIFIYIYKIFDRTTLPQFCHRSEKIHLGQ